MKSIVCPFSVNQCDGLLRVPFAETRATVSQSANPDVSLIRHSSSVVRRSATHGQAGRRQSAGEAAPPKLLPR